MHRFLCSHKERWNHFAKIQYYSDIHINLKKHFSVELFELLLFVPAVLSACKPHCYFKWEETDSVNGKGSEKGNTQPFEKSTNAFFSVFYFCTMCCWCVFAIFRTVRLDHSFDIIYRVGKEPRKHSWESAYKEWNNRWRLETIIIPSNASHHLFIGSKIDR